jgi:hypothetical protein
MRHEYDDGGRQEAGFKGDAGDCFVRAVAIATERPYREVYDEVLAFCKAEKRRKKISHPRKGVFSETAKAYLAEQGWTWVPTMGIGTGCTVHLKAEELPQGRIICSLSRHFAAVVDGVLRDSYDCSRDGTRCVYGYWKA